ncbi:MAG: TetR/AcrR family transcriptional regulator [Cyanobacteria bacterium J06635_15]
MANLKRTREDILEAVIDTIHRQGLTATKLSELFHLSGASAGSFYNYFDSKQELGHALIDWEWKLLQQQVLEPSAELSSTPIAQIFWILDALEAKQRRDPFCGGCLLGNLVVDLVEQDATFRDHLMRIFNRWEGAIAQILRQGKSELCPEADPDILAEQIMTVVEGAMLMGKLHRDSNRLKRNFDIARQLVKQALKTPPSLPSPGN